MTLKDIARRALRAALQGPEKGLGKLGRLAKRLARHLDFQIVNLEKESFHRLRPSIEPEVWPAGTNNGIVYDFGANHGANIPYYRRQGFRVIAIEANPIVFKALVNRFENDNAVTIVNACIVAEATGDVDFYVNHHSDKLSTKIAPGINQAEFEKISVPSATPSMLFERYGVPFYVKIDIEGADAEIVNAFSKLNYKIPYISAEIFSIDVLAALISNGYVEFKIVEGAYVHFDRYLLPGSTEKEEFRFTKGECAGPFGEDIPGRWVSADDIMAYLVRYGLGWKDLHARNIASMAERDS